MRLTTQRNHGNAHPEGTTRNRVATPGKYVQQYVHARKDLEKALRRIATVKQFQTVSADPMRLEFAHQPLLVPGIQLIPRNQQATSINRQQNPCPGLDDLCIQFFQLVQGAEGDRPIVHGTTDRHIEGVRRRPEAGKPTCDTQQLLGAAFTLAFRRRIPVNNSEIHGIHTCGVRIADEADLATRRLAGKHPEPTMLGTHQFPRVEADEGEFVGEQPPAPIDQRRTQGAFA